MCRPTLYKGFKIIPVTEHTCVKYGAYFEDYMINEYMIINPNDEYEWQEGSKEHCKQWIDCY